MYRLTVIFWFIFPKPPHISCLVATEILHVFLVVLGLLFLAVLNKHHRLLFLSSYSFPSSSPGKTFLRAPQMNINIATWGRLVRRAIPTVSTNSFSPQAAETGPSSLPGSPTPSRYSHAHTWTKDINMSLLIHMNYKKDTLLKSGHLPIHSDPLVTKLDFDKEPTPGPKHYPAPDNIQEPLVQDKMPDKEEVQVQCFRNPWYCWCNQRWKEAVCESHSWCWSSCKKLFLWNSKECFPVHHTAASQTRKACGENLADNTKADSIRRKYAKYL